MFITARKRSLGQGNIFTNFCHSVHRQGVCIQESLPLGRSASRGVCIQGGLHPGRLHQTLERLSPPYQILWDMINEWAVRILLECILVYAHFVSLV